MQKKLIALAIAGLASSAAFAADNVTIYGRMDYGYLNQSGTSGGVQNVNSKNSLGSGLQAGSRIGFKGAEDLGNGLKAIFEAEFGIAVDQTQAPLTGTSGVTGAGAAVTTSSVSQGTAATWVNRHSYVGLTGNFGTVVGGRLDGVRYGIFNKYDAFAGGTVGNFTQMTGQVDRADNAIAYISPNFSGFTGTLAYATNIAGPENAGNQNDLRLNTFMLNYANGPLDLTADYETVKGVEVTTRTAAVAGVAAVPGVSAAIPGAAATGGDVDVRVTTLGGSYDFGVVKLSALWDSHKVDTNGARTTDYRDYFISARAPIAGSKFIVKATYGQVKNKLTSNSDANKFGLGLDYALSKRTNLYADYGRISQDNAATFQVSAAANANGNNGTNGFDIGIAHNF